jgi:VWFA-related protein
VQGSEFTSSLGIWHSAPGTRHSALGTRHSVSYHVFMRAARVAWISCLVVAGGIALAARSRGVASHLQAQPPKQSQQQPQQQPLRHAERVEVSRVLIDARALDDFGEPIRGLTASDFRVRIDGKAARVESAYWVGASAPDSSPGAAPAPATPSAPVPEEARGRLIVFLFQKDLEPSRIVGLMRMLIQTRAFLDSLGPDDRVAVLSFDYRLKIWLDFTNRFDRVREVFEKGILFRDPPPVEPVTSPALMSTLDVVRASRAYSMEEALALLGQALEPLPGSKSVVLVGYGFGRLAGSSLIIEGAYGEARRAFQAARASVFCLDVTDADAHTLEAGLQMTAEDTGGFFARTHLFPGQAMQRLAGALSGHYVLFVEVTTPVEKRSHEVEVDLPGRKGTVLAKRHYSSAP